MINLKQAIFNIGLLQFCTPSIFSLSWWYYNIKSSITFDFILIKKILNWIKSDSWHVRQCFCILSCCAVDGCRQLRPPPGAWVQLSGNFASVHCNESKETWYLTCSGNHWMGLTGNCSERGNPWFYVFCC